MGISLTGGWENQSFVTMEEHSHGDDLIWQDGCPSETRVQFPGSRQETALTLYLNIEQYENMIGPNFAAGLKILLFDENDIPVFNGQGQGLAAGGHVFAGTSVIVMKRLPKPYGNCSNDRKLEYYDKYSERACYMECFTKFFVNKTRCRMPYMKVPDPVCTLYQYAEHFRRMQVEYDRLQEQICNCPSPCETLTYRPSFSYLKASDFDIDKLLNEKIKTKLRKKLREARDTLRATDPELKDRDATILGEFVKNGRALEKLLMEELPSQTRKQKEETRTIRNNIKGIHRGIIDMYEFQRFVVRKNFYRFTQYNDEMYFSEVSTGYLEFFTYFMERLRKMQRLFDEGTVDMREPERRRRLHSLEELLEAKNRVIDLSLSAIRKCLESYNNGTMAFDTPYQYQNKSWDSHLDIIPKKRLYEALASGFDDFGNLDTKNGFFKSLFDLKEFYYNLNKTALKAYKGQFRESMVIPLRKEYIEMMGNYLGNRSILMTDIFYQPVKGIEEFMQDLDDIYQKVEDGFVKIFAKLESIEKMSNRTVTKLWLPIAALINSSNAYRRGSGDSKVDLASGFIHPKTRDTIQTIYEYLDDVFNVVDDIVTKWDYIHDQFMEILLKKKVMRDEDVKAYLQHYEPGWADEESFKKTRDFKEIDQVRTTSKYWAMLAQKIEDRQEPFNDAFYTVITDMKDYVAGNIINERVYKKNFISLVIYFEAMNYELIEQQAAYTIFALLSDLGGSMGLFVGGSVISLFELIDVIVYNQVFKTVAGSKRRIKKNKSINGRDKTQSSESGKDYRPSTMMCNDFDRITSSYQDVDKVTRV